MYPLSLSRDPIPVSANRWVFPRAIEHDEQRWGLTDREIVQDKGNSDEEDEGQGKAQNSPLQGAKQTAIHYPGFLRERSPNVPNNKHRGFIQFHDGGRTNPSHRDHLLLLYWERHGTKEAMDWAERGETWIDYLRLFGIFRRVQKGTPNAFTTCNFEQIVKLIKLLRRSGDQASV